MGKKRVPEIRFKGFEGEWEERELRTLSSLITKGTSPRDTNGERIVNFIKIENISALSGEIKTSTKITLKEHEGYLKRSQLQEDDVLFSIAGTLGRVSVVSKDILPANTNQALAIIRFQKGNIRFVTTFLKGKAISKYLKKNPTVGAQPNLSLEQVGSLDISLPLAENEQSQIGTFFQNLDSLITLHQRKHDKLSTVKKAMLEKMFPKEGEDVPEIRFKGFTGKWEKKRLGEVCDEFHSGKFIKAEGIKSHSRYPVFGGNGLRGYTDTYNHAGTYALIGRQGALCGNVNISYGKAYFTEHAIAVSANKNNNTVFLFYVLVKMNLRQYSGQSAQPGLAVNKIIELTPKLPEYKEQSQIAAFFQHLESLISLHQRELDKLKNIKKACLEKMFV